MSLRKIISLCADSEGLRVQFCRVGRNMKIVVTQLCTCPEPRRALVHVSRNVALEELEAVPEVLDIHVEDAVCELKDRRRQNAHSHEKENATTKGLRVRS